MVLLYPRRTPEKKRKRDTDGGIQNELERFAGSIFYSFAPREGKGGRKEREEDEFARCR